MEGKSLLPGLWHQPSSFTTLPRPDTHFLGAEKGSSVGDRGRCAWEEVGGFEKPWELGYR